MLRIKALAWPMAFNGSQWIFILASRFWPFLVLTPWFLTCDCVHRSVKERQRVEIWPDGFCSLKIVFRLFLLLVNLHTSFILPIFLRLLRLDFLSWCLCEPLLMPPTSFLFNKVIHMIYTWWAFVCFLNLFYSSLFFSEKKKYFNAFSVSIFG